MPKIAARKTTQNTHLGKQFDQLIDLLLGLFRGAVFHNGGRALKQPIKQLTQTPTSTMFLVRNLMHVCSCGHVRLAEKPPLQTLFNHLSQFSLQNIPKGISRQKADFQSGFAGKPSTLRCLGARDSNQDPLATRIARIVSRDFKKKQKKLSVCKKSKDLRHHSASNGIWGCDANRAILNRCESVRFDQLRTVHRESGHLSP